MAFATIDVTKGITGTIPVANGGTGLASGTTGQFLKFTGSTTLAPAEAGGGKLLQTQSALFTSSSAHNTESYTASNYTDQITPSATDSKIFVCFNLRSHIYQASGSTVRSQLAIYRQINGGGFSEFFPANAGISWGIGVSSGERTFYNTPQITFMDTTHNPKNAIDFTLYARRNTSSTGSVNVGGSSVQAQVILMEIAA